MKLSVVVHLKSGEIVRSVVDECTDIEYHEIIKILRNIVELKYFSIVTSKTSKCYFNPNDISYIEIITPEN